MEYAALMQLSSVWLGTKIYLFTGASPSEIIEEMEQRIDIPYMLTQGGDFELENRQLLPVIEAFYAKYTAGEITMEDISAMDYTLKVGQIICLETAVGASDISALISRHPEAIRIR